LFFILNISVLSVEIKNCQKLIVFQQKKEKQVRMNSS